MASRDIMRNRRLLSLNFFSGNRQAWPDSPPCLECAEWVQPRRNLFVHGMTDAFDLLGVDDAGHLHIWETKAYGDEGWRKDALAFMLDKVSMYYDLEQAMHELGLEPDENPAQERLFEPDEAAASKR